MSDKRFDASPKGHLLAHCEPGHGIERGDVPRRYNPEFLCLVIEHVARLTVSQQHRDCESNGTLRAAWRLACEHQMRLSEEKVKREARPPRPERSMGERSCRLPVAGVPLGRLSLLSRAAADPLGQGQDVDETAPRLGQEPAAASSKPQDQLEAAARPHLSPWAGVRQTDCVNTVFLHFVQKCTEGAPKPTA